MNTLDESSLLEGYLSAKSFEQIEAILFDQNDNKAVERLEFLLSALSSSGNAQILDYYQRYLIHLETICSPKELFAYLRSCLDRFHDDSRLLHISFECLIRQLKTFNLRPRALTALDTCQILLAYIQSCDFENKAELVSVKYIINYLDLFNQVGSVLLSCCLPLDDRICLEFVEVCCKVLSDICVRIHRDFVTDYADYVLVLGDLLNLLSFVANDWVLIMEEGFQVELNVNDEDRHTVFAAVLYSLLIDHVGYRPLIYEHFHQLTVALPHVVCLLRSQFDAVQLKGLELLQHLFGFVEAGYLSVDYIRTDSFKLLLLALPPLAIYSNREKIRTVTAYTVRQIFSLCTPRGKCGMIRLFIHHVSEYAFLGFIVSLMHQYLGLCLKGGYCTSVKIQLSNCFRRSNLIDLLTLIYNKLHFADWELIVTESELLISYLNLLRLLKTLPQSVITVQELENLKVEPNKLYRAIDIAKLNYKRMMNETRAQLDSSEVAELTSDRVSIEQSLTRLDLVHHVLTLAVDA